MFLKDTISVVSKYSVIAAAMEMLCVEKQWRHCTDADLPSIIDEGVMFHTSLTHCM